MIPRATGLGEHPLAGAIEDLPALRLFMEHHVFAVWDFLLLAKALQRQLAAEWRSGAVPGLGAAVTMLDRIVAEEECDRAPPNPLGASHLSHLQIYLLAMREVGACTVPIEALIERLRGREVWRLSPARLDAALDGLPIPPPARRFTAFTLELIHSGEALPMAAAFTHGRELLVPALFRSLLERAPIPPPQAPSLHWYLSRHIAIDAEDHGPAALVMLDRLCGDSPGRRRTAEATARRAIEVRRRFWDDIHHALVAPLQRRRR